MGNYAKSQESDKLTASKFGPFTVIRRIGGDAVTQDFSIHTKIYPVLHVQHAILYVEQ